MADEFDEPPVQQLGEGLDNPLRAIIVVNSKDAPEGEMEERMLDSVQTFGEVDKFFDRFDEVVAIPNEEHIKYEVGSDGLVVFVVDSVKLKGEVLGFLDDFVTDAENSLKNDEADSGAEKKKKKTK